MSALLEIRELSKRFGGVDAVRSVTLEVTRGQMVGLIGPNGAGKTTLVNLVSKHESPDSGSILLDSRPIHRLPAYRVARAGVSRTYQKNRLFWEESVGENIRTTIASSRVERTASDGLSYPGATGDEEERTESLLAFLGLAACRDAYPGDLSHVLRRRAELAQALALAPKLLLLDEPFAGLTRSESLDFVRLLRETQKGGLTTLLIDHNMKVVMELCEYLFVMHHGALIASGAPQEIRANERVVSVYLAGEL